MIGVFCCFFSISFSFYCLFSFITIVICRYFLKQSVLHPSLSTIPVPTPGPEVSCSYVCILSMGIEINHNMDLSVQFFYWEVLHDKMMKNTCSRKPLAIDGNYLSFFNANMRAYVSVAHFSLSSNTVFPC